MRRTALVRVVLAAHTACAAANLVLAAVWSSWALAVIGVGWALIASVLHAHRRASTPEAVEPAHPLSDEPTVPQGS